MSKSEPTDLDRIKAEAAFYGEVLPLEVELEEARENKAKDPERFQVAKQAFEEQRSYFRQIAEYLKATAEGADDRSKVVINVGAAIPTVADVIPPAGTEKKGGRK